MLASIEADLGQLLVGGYAGPEGQQSLEALVRQGRAGGVILFRRNLEGSLEDVRSLTDTIHGWCPGDPPMIALDQEGGRVQRLRSPFPELPPMRVFGDLGRKSVVHRAGRVLGASLRVMGFDQNYAPVIDVDSNPDNPVIGDRAFASDPHLVSRLGAAFIDGMQSEGVAACGKHFPGHGDTDLDSHLDLPRLSHDLERLRAVELPPFRAAARADVAAIMTAHVVFAALDELRPATLSPPMMALLRDEIRYDGVVVSDDLEMQAIARSHSVAEAAVQAIEAGCDQLLVCRHPDLLSEAYEALLTALTEGRIPPVRIRRSAERVRALKRRFVRVGAPPSDLQSSFPLDEIEELNRALEGQPTGGPLVDPTERD